MSRAQNPFHEQMLTLNILAEQLLKVTDAVQALRDQMNNLQINPSGERFPEAISVSDCSIRESRDFNKYICPSYASNPRIRWT